MEKEEETNKKKFSRKIYEKNLNFIEMQKPSRVRKEKMEMKLELNGIMVAYLIFQK